MILRQSQPRTIAIGESVTLDAEVYADADTTSQLTASAGTVEIVIDGAQILAPAAVSVGGASTATYALAGSVTTGQPPSAGWLETWTLTISGVPQVFRRAGYLVRTVYRPTATDADLLMLHPDLADSRKGILPAGATFAPYRQRAAQHIQRHLLSKGRRPWLIFDAWAHHDAEVALTLAYAFTDAHASISDERYKDLAAHYREAFSRAIETVPYRYDGEEDGMLTDSAQSGSWRPTTLSAGPSRRRLR